jgi:hypothetical protein
MSLTKELILDIRRIKIEPMKINKAIGQEIASIKLGAPISFMTSLPIFEVEDTSDINETRHVITPRRNRGSDLGPLFCLSCLDGISILIYHSTFGVKGVAITTAHPIPPIVLYDQFTYAANPIFCLVPAHFPDFHQFFGMIILLFLRGTCPILNQSCRSHILMEKKFSKEEARGFLKQASSKHDCSWGTESWRDEASKPPRQTKPELSNQLAMI